MVETRVQRRLAAILVADVVGYSRLMGEDEEGTRSQFNSHLNTLIAPKIADHHGRVVKTMGDGLLVEFASAIDAVQCAFEFQTAIMASNADTPERQRMSFRVGVNLGDVIVEGEDLHGDGVNVAARLEGLAEPGGVIVSGIVHEIVRTKVEFGFDDLGSQEVKNIAERVPAFRIRVQAGVSPVVASKPSGKEAPRPISDKPSIAVLPFANLGVDPEQEYFADGITEDLITDLSKVSGLFVIARNSSFAFKGKTLDSRDVARRLGVRHVLEGSVRRAGDKIRINAQLVEAKTGDQLWAERYDGEFADIFSLQDDITARIVSSLELHLTSSKLDGGIRQPTRNPEAYDLCLKGRSEYYLYAPDHMAKAKGFFEQAIAKDPDYAEAYAYLSYCRTAAYVFAWPGSDENLDIAVALAEKSVALDDNSAVAHARLGWVLGYLDRFDDAVANFDRAVAIDPRNAEAFFAYGETMNRRGDPERALPLLEMAFSIDTFVPPSWEFAKGHSFVLMQRYDAALSQILPVIERVPRFLPARVQLARAYAETDRIADAEDMVQSILKIAPKYGVGSASRMFPYPNENDRHRFLDALRKAGLPE